MAWRIDRQVLRGEIDNRTRGRVVGRVWLVGWDVPLELILEGNTWRDLAGHLLQFSNPHPEARDLEGLAKVQRGRVGDMTASRKVKVPDCAPGEFEKRYAARQPVTYRWGNALHLEWFSERNGRVVLEATGFELKIDADAAWEMSSEEESKQRIANAKALTEFMQHLSHAVGAEEESVHDELDDDEPQSRAEAEADAEAARMDLLLDRVEARLRREGGDEESFERILDEERARLRRERGEPEEEELTPEQEAERDAWIEEMNAISAEATAGMEAEKGKGKDRVKPRRPPLVDRASEFAVKVHKEVRAGGWIPENAQREHPLIEIVNGTMAASAKLAGALGMEDGEEEWPPPAIFAGDILVRLKKARGSLRDVLRGLDSADEATLSTPAWRAATRTETAEILGEVQQLITEVREVLRDDEE